MGRAWAGIVLSALFSLAAHRRGALSPSGVVGAIPIGAAIWVAGGWRWSLPLLTFFTTSSLFSSWPLGRKRPRRSLGQALANGGFPAVLAYVYGKSKYQPLAIAYVGAIAAANADTWATEIGRISGTKPVMITSFRAVPVGTSGAISLPGSLAALAGDAAVALTAWQTVEPKRGEREKALLAILLGGLAGTMIDSILGATWQGIYQCSVCGQETEERTHCHHPTRLVRGYRWIDNNAVNLLCSVTGGLASLALWQLLSRRGVQ